MRKKRVNYLAVFMGVLLLAAIAGGGYYFTHKQEIAKLYTNSKFMSKYSRYTQYARQLVSGDIKFKDANIGVFYVCQLVADDNATKRTITFAAKDKQAFSVEYQKKSGFNSSKTVKATDISFKDGNDEYIQYVAKLENLEPATKYEYRIVGANSKGSWHALETSSKKNFTAMIFADSQSADYATWRKISATAFSKNSDAKLYLNLGDHVDNGQHKWQWEQWFNGIEAYSADIPMATLIGNHELYNLKWQERFPVVHKKLFSFPAPVEKYKNQFYSFDYGDVHFVVLDTNHRDEMVPYQPYLASAQFAWLKNDLASTKAKWKVALMHRDIIMYSYAKGSGYTSNWQPYFDYPAQDFMPIFERYGVDAVLSGHMHTYRRRVKLKHFMPNDNGITYIMLGVSGDQPKEGLWSDFEWDAKRIPNKKNASSYMTLSVKDNQMKLKAFLADGQQFDEVVLKK